MINSLGRGEMENSHSEVRVDETVTAVAFDALDRGEVSHRFIVMILPLK